MYRVGLSDRWPGWRAEPLWLRREADDNDSGESHLVRRTCWRYAMLYFYYTILYYTMLYYIMLYYTMLYYTLEGSGSPTAGRAGGLAGRERPRVKGRYYYYHYY